MGPESMTTDREYGFRARDFVAPRNDDCDYFIAFSISAFTTLSRLSGVIGPTSL
jgi:hypothetical protein